MTNTVMHIFRKDIRHLRVLLVVWSLLILSQAALIGSGIGARADNMATQVAFQILSFVLPMLKGLMVIAMIPLLVHDEPLVGTTAFWFTRPLSRGDLLGSKALFIGLMLILFPMAVDLAVLAGNGVLPQHVLLAAPEILISELSSAVMVLVLAVLTPNFARFAIVGVVAMVALIMFSVAVSLAQLFLGGMDSLSGKSITLQLSRSLVGSCITIAAGCAVVVNQYLTRRTSHSIAAAGVGAALMLAATTFWPIDLLGSPRVELPKEVADCANIYLSLDSDRIYASDEFRMRGKDKQRKEIRASIKVTGLDRRYAASPEEVRSMLQLADGAILTSTNLNTVTSSFGRWQPDALQVALGDARLVNKSRFSMDVCDLLTVNLEDYQKYGKQPGVLTAEVDLRVTSYRIAAEIPLKKGARYDAGSEHVVISDILKQPAGCTVLLRQSTVNLLFGGHDQNAAKARQRRVMPFMKNTLYVLRNKARKEAVMPEDDMSVDFSFMNEAQRLVISPLRVVFAPEQRHDERKIPDIDEAWLEGADLLRIEVVEYGNCRGVLVDEKFTMVEPKENAD